MSQAQQRIERLKAILLYTIMRIEQHCQENGCSTSIDGHKLWKVLYFADREHLARYGRTITEEDYIAMDHGPVPSQLYDVVKIAQGKRPYSIAMQRLFQPIITAIRTHGTFYIEGREEPDLEELSPSEIKCLDTSVKENCLLGFGDRSNKSHDLAWHSTQRNREIDVSDIARAGGANEEMIKYITESQENQSIAKNTFNLPVR